MKKQQYSSGLHKVYSFQFKNFATRIPISQIKYCQSNFIKFFKLKKNEFKSKKILTSDFRLFIKG